MDLKRDGQAYLLSRITGELTDEKQGNDFFRDYLVSCGRLRRTPQFVGKNFSFLSEELPFVSGTEDCLERLVAVLDSFLRVPYCVEKVSAIFIDSTVSLYQTDLIVELETLKKINLEYGWKKLYENLSSAVCKIEAAIIRLTAVAASGKNVRFFTNLCAEDFLSPTEINFHFTAAKYFIAASGAAYKGRE